MAVRNSPGGSSSRCQYKHPVNIGMRVMSRMRDTPRLVDHPPPLTEPDCYVADHGSSLVSIWASLYPAPGSDAPAGAASSCASRKSSPVNVLGQHDQASDQGVEGTSFPAIAHYTIPDEAPAKEPMAVDLSDETFQGILGGVAHSPARLEGDGNCAQL